MYEIDLYINSSKLLQKLVYLKTKFTKDNTIDIQNIVNVNKLNINQLNNSNDDSNNNSSNDIKPYYTLQGENDQTLLFESRFESGNLLCAFKIDDNNYQLYLQNDTNTTGYIQWFFFRITNIHKNKKVNFTLINMLRKTSLYNNGLHIMCYSVKKAKKENIGWHRAGSNVMYYPNNLFVYTKERRRNLYSLRFDYEFKYDNDEIYFANCIPYLYSDIMKELNYYQLNETKFPFFHRKTLCTTLGGNNLDMFSINTECLSSLITQSTFQYYQEKDKRKGIVLIARQHPGETVSSFVMKGAIEFLMSNSDESKKLRQLYLIRIVPMMNPDGVLVGNSRTSFAGCDLNRRWECPSETIHPEIYHTKEMILKMATQREIAFICDFHGHIGAFNSFFYCNHKENKRTCSLFPFLCSKISKYISYSQSNFKMPRYKKGTGRMRLFEELNLDNIVTLETSFFGTNRINDKNRFYFNKQMLKEIGKDICLGMLSYYYKYIHKSVDKVLICPAKLDIDMNEFEQEIQKEQQREEELKHNNSNNNNNDKININGCVEENSESEPSIDNFDKERLSYLMPTKSKKRRKKIKTNIRKLFKVDSTKKIFKYNIPILNETNNNNNNNRQEIKLFKPNNKPLKQLEIKAINKSKSMSKIAIKCKETTENQITKIIKDKKDIIRKDAETQTEEIFFKMHWSYFVGDYVILQGVSIKKRLVSSRDKYNAFHALLTPRQRSVGQMRKTGMLGNYMTNMKIQNKNKSNNNGLTHVTKSNLFVNMQNPNSYIHSNYNNNNNKNNSNIRMQTNHFIRKSFIV